VMQQGARDVLAAATHPVLVGLAIERLQESAIRRVIVSDTIPCEQRCRKIEDKLTVLSVAGLLGKAIHRIHHDQSISALFKPGVAVKR
jgi:ribose-phosphate pyrophosphokinase